MKHFFSKGFLLSLLISGGAVNAQVPGLDEYVGKVLSEFNVPGVSIAVVKDGKVVSAKGFGISKLGSTQKVNAQTLFGIASNSKAFTATALGLLVEEGKLKWDDPVIQYLPDFRLSDPYVTSQLTIRDLLVHRSGLGLGAGDLLWWPASDYNRKEIVHRLRFIPLKTSFRSAYAYDNVLYLVAGEVIEQLTGMSWEEFVQSRILNKLGMLSTNVRHSAAANNGNVAATHAVVDGKLQVVAPMTSDNTNPAGGINSNADDMAKWLITQLDSGRVDGTQRRLFSRATSRELWTLVTPQGIGNPAPELSPLKSNFRGYALGFEVRDYRGKKLVTHTGGLPGYLSRVAMIPELKLGVSVLTNQESGYAFEAITYKILDYYLQAAPHDWLAAFARVRDRNEAAVAEEEAGSKEQRHADSKPSLPLDRYVQTYEDAWYGAIEVTKEGEGLAIRFAKTPSLKGKLTHWQYNTFIAEWADRELRADAFVTFNLNPDGSIRDAFMEAVSPATDFSFDFQDLHLKPVAK